MTCREATGYHTCTCCEKTSQGKAYSVTVGSAVLILCQSCARRLTSILDRKTRQK